MRFGDKVAAAGQGMSMSRRKLLSLVLPATAFASIAMGATDAERRIRLFEQTKIVAVMGLPGPASDFKDDGDPETLQIVFLDKHSDGPSRVSDDGEVIFLYKASEKKQQELIAQAFEIRLARESADPEKS
jgi:hypothetical protein